MDGDDVQPPILHAAEHRSRSWIPLDRPGVSGCPSARSAPGASVQRHRRFAASSTRLAAGPLAVRPRLLRRPRPGEQRRLNKRIFRRLHRGAPLCPALRSHEPPLVAGARWPRPPLLWRRSQSPRPGLPSLISPHPLNAGAAQHFCSPCMWVHSSSDPELMSNGRICEPSHASIAERAFTPARRPCRALATNHSALQDVDLACVQTRANDAERLRDRVLSRPAKLRTIDRLLTAEEIAERPGMRTD